MNEWTKLKLSFTLAILTSIFIVVLSSYILN